MEGIMKYALFLIVFILSACGGGPKVAPTPTTTPQERAWYACTSFIQQQLDLSILDAQDYTPSGVTTSGGDQYTVEVFYADQGDTYRCELARHANGDWQLLSLEVK